MSSIMPGNMTSKVQDYYNYTVSKIQSLDAEFQSAALIIFILIILVIFIGYLIYLSNLQTSECNFMNSLYSVDNNIKPITASNQDFSGNFYDYYIKTAYNACSGGSYKNDFVNTCNLVAVIKQGVRCLDFEVYSIDHQPVVATSTVNNNYVKETFNSVPFSDVLQIITTYAFSGGSCPNPKDPLIIHIRFQSSDQKMFTNLAKMFEQYDNLMLGNEYSFENAGKNLGKQPLLSFQGKIILIVDRTETSFLDNQSLLEYVNMTSNSVFSRIYQYSDIVNTPDAGELTDYNRRAMTIVTPNVGINPGNPSGYLCRAYGCQMIAMRYQYVDTYLEENALFFDKCGYAFCLKPERLRYIEVTIADPTPQNPDYSYGTRHVETNYYSFKY